MLNQHLGVRQCLRVLCCGDLNSELVPYSNGPTINGHLNSKQVKVCYSDVSAFQMFTIQMPTVVFFGMFLPHFPLFSRKNEAEKVKKH